MAINVNKPQYSSSLMPEKLNKYISNKKKINKETN